MSGVLVYICNRERVCAVCLTTIVRHTFAYTPLTELVSATDVPSAAMTLRCAVPPSTEKPMSGS